RRRGALARVVERHLAEVLPGAEDGEQVIATVRCDVAELDLPGPDHEQPITLGALMEDLLTTTEREFGGALTNRAIALVTELGEERSGSDRGLVHLGFPSSRCEVSHSLPFFWLPVCPQR